jgi:hypothetical protein
MHSFVSCLIALAFLSSSLLQERVTAEITFCNFELPDQIKTANASFNVSYSFELDEEGQPVSITKVRDDYVGEEKVTSCLRAWRFRGVRKGAKMVALFRWQHADGWVEVSVSGPDFSQRIKVTGDRCPYLRMQSGIISKPPQKRK